MIQTISYQNIVWNFNLRIGPPTMIEFHSYTGKIENLFESLYD